MAGITGMDHYLLPEDFGIGKSVILVIAALVIIGIVIYLSRGRKKKRK